MKVHLAYGRDGLDVELPDSAHVLLPERVPTLADPAAAVQAALRQPIASPPLRDLVRPGQTAAIVFLSLAFWLALYTWGAWGDFVKGLEDYFVRMLGEITKATPADQEMQVQWALLKDHAAGIAYYAVRLLPAMVFKMSCLSSSTGVLGSARWRSSWPFWRL